MVDISNNEKEVLSKLAGRVREIAEDKSMPERKKRLKALNSLKADRPVVLVFPEGCHGKEPSLDGRGKLLELLDLRS